MKHTLIATLLVLTAFVGHSHANPTAGISLLPVILGDIGAVGPNGEVLLYYREGDHIVVKNCEPMTVLGATPADARAKCKGKMNKVPVESFKNAIRNIVSTAGLTQLRPLTEAELEAYRKKDGLSLEETQKLQEELDKINAFIGAYGKENAPLIRKEEIEKSLKTNEGRAAALEKVNEQIEKVIKGITDDKKLTIVDSSSLNCKDQDEKVKNQFMYAVLKKFDPNQEPCGLSGTIKKKIKDCSVLESSVKGNFTLVSRGEDFTEIHKDNKSGLIWSDRLPLLARPTYDKAVSSCDGLPKIDGKSWRLPSIDEFIAAKKNGIHLALPKMNHTYWTSTEYDGNEKGLWYLNPHTGTSGFTYRDNPVIDGIRCVAE